MVKKYKLVKEYPGSPPLETEVLACIVATRPYYRYKIRNTYAPALSASIVENHPEYWELIVEKQYEILQVTGTKILSIRRLSDGEEFKLGDVVIITGPNSYKQDARDISEIELRNGNIILHSSKLGRPVFYNTANDSLGFKIERVTPKLFTSEDGVDIHLGDTFYYIFNNGLANAFYINECQVNSVEHYEDHYKIKSPNDHRKFFSTKEAAKDYIALHKPVLSYTEIASLSTLTAYQGKLLLALTKEKLKNA